jgi:hypothetical protein
MPERTETRGTSRRLFLQHAVLGGTAAVSLGWADLAAACDVPVTGAPWPSVDGWQHRTILHFLNTVMPGDDGQALFDGDTDPLRSGGDTSPGAWAACALDVFYDPFYGAAGFRGQLFATALDAVTRLKGYGPRFYQASQAEQLAVVDALVRLPLTGPGVGQAIALGLDATLGATRNDAVTRLIGWPGPCGGYYDDARHPTAGWRQPERMTLDGNLP